MDLEEEIEKYHQEIRRIQLEIDRLQTDIQEENLLKTVSQTDLIHLQDQLEQQIQQRSVFLHSLFTSTKDSSFFQSNSISTRSNRKISTVFEGNFFDYFKT